jgi:hypothetical protein
VGEISPFFLYIRDMITKFKLFEGSVKSNERIDIFRDDKYVLVAPLTSQASAKYGADTHWCTSALDCSYLWTEDNTPNHPNSNRGLLILIRRNYVLTDENAAKSEEFYFLTQEMNGGDMTEEKHEKWNELQGDIESYDLSKICITFSKEKYNYQVWSANNIDLEINLEELRHFDIDHYIIEEIENYIRKEKYK